MFDAAIPWQLSFQDSASPNFTGITELHDILLFYLIVISVSVLCVLGNIIYLFNNPHIFHKYWNHATLLEIIWTIVPAVILMYISWPSFNLLYVTDEVISPSITVKTVGHQWYWSFEYSDYENESGDPIEFDSYMLPESDLELGQLRLLDVDNKVNIPVDTHVRFIVTGADVIHDYAIPSLGIKVDAVPGRLNQASTVAERLGTFYGQCSEICGPYHGFMPSAVESLSVSDYLSWIDSAFVGIFTLLSNNIKKIKNNTPFPLKEREII